MNTADLQGHWRRDWLRHHGGEDQTTRVHWLQAGKIYADIRVPADRGEVPRDLTTLTEPPQSLVAAEGYAGRIDVEGGVCTWTRAIAWHGASPRPDAGHVAFAPDGALLETGVHADYTERWVREDVGPTEAQVLRCGSLTAYVVSVGSSFVFGCGVAEAPPLRTEESGLDTAALEALFLNVYILGRWERADGLALLATDPRLEGRAVVERRETGLTLRALDLQGAPRSVIFTPADQTPQSSR
ncbi:MAG: hypothetical protein AAGI50_13690 [Pseudomonadota bacterium]